MMAAAISVWSLFGLVYLLLHLQALKTARGGGKRNLLAAPMARLLNRPPIYRHLLGLLQRPQAALAALHGGACTRERLIGWAAEALGLSYAVFLSVGLLGIAAESPELVPFGAVVAALMPLLRWRELKEKVNRHRQSIVLELPELLNRLLLMVNAGENVMRALERCVQRQAADGHPLYAELRSALEAMKRGETMAIAMEEFGRRCAVPEAKMFASTLLTNAKRGGETFVSSLRELSQTLWERRKAVARTLGEQASSKMAFPLVLIFLIVMVLVGTPAMFMMSI
ncbi:type II secretion system F family protein [Cohnella algarum]|uniref:type II secretion system F family protein n=1 Tax=Cohnella algarum TaxID=2044859 RepID=UPI0019686DDC|nr:type II secretion system F family protein [Cohnella algarum]MBN2980067.1 type II secretion system F family protein [Cohnella algarum]